MIIRKHEGYKIRHFSADVDRIVYIKNIVMDHEKDFFINTRDEEQYCIRKDYVECYEKESGEKNEISWIFLKQLDCGVIKFKNSYCIHEWANVGFNWTFCKKCHAQGWNNKGVIVEK